MKRVLAWIVELALFQVFYYLQHYLWVLVHLGTNALNGLSTTLSIVLGTFGFPLVFFFFFVLSAGAAALVIWLCQRVHRSPLGKRYRVLAIIYIVFFSFVGVLAASDVISFGTQSEGYLEVLTMIVFCGCLVFISKERDIYT